MSSYHHHHHHHVRWIDPYDRQPGFVVAIAQLVAINIVPVINDYTDGPSNETRTRRRPTVDEDRLLEQHFSNRGAKFAAAYRPLLEDYHWKALVVVVAAVAVAGDCIVGSYVSNVRMVLYQLLGRASFELFRYYHW